MKRGEVAETMEQPVRNAEINRNPIFCIYIFYISYSLLVLFIVIYGGEAFRSLFCDTAPPCVKALLWRGY